MCGSKPAAAQARNSGRRQPAGPLAVRDERDGLRAAEGDGVEEPKAAHDLVELAPGGAGVHQVDLEGPQVVGPELVGGPAEVLGELGHPGHVGLDGPGGVVADAQVVDESPEEMRVVQDRA